MSVQKDVIASKAFKDNFGRYMLWSGMYNESILYSGAIQVFLITHTAFLAYTIVLAIDDEKLMGESAHFTAFRISAIMLLTNCFLNKEDVETLFIKLGQSHVHDYENTLNDQCKKQIEAVRKNCDVRKDFYGTNFLRTVTAALVIFWVRSLMEYYRGSLDNPKGDNGINKNLPVPTYLPYESHEWPGYHFALLCEVALVMMSYFLVLGHDCSFICFSEEFLRELEIIIITLREVEERSEHLRKEMKYKISLKESINLCLKHSVCHHQKVIHIFGSFKRYCFYSLFFMLSGGAFLICLSSLMFTSDKITLQDKSVFLMFLGNELFHIFIFCYYGEHIMEKGALTTFLGTLFRHFCRYKFYVTFGYTAPELTPSTEVGNSLYNSSWIRISQYVRPVFILVKLRCQSPLSLSAGGFMTAGFDTYGNVLRTAYSYLNLLQATN